MAARGGFGPLYNAPGSSPGRMRPFRAPAKDSVMEASNPLRRFPSKMARLSPFFRSMDGPSESVAYSDREIEKRERWLQMDKFDPSFGVSGATQEVIVRRTYRRMESSRLFYPPRLAASLSELSDSPAPLNKRYVLVEESRLRELAQIEAILREEKEALGEQCSWIMSDYHIDARIPIPATRVAVDNLCEADMRRLAREFDTLNAAWFAYSRQQHYDRDIAHTSLPHKSYIGNAPLALRPVKLLMLEAERSGRQLKMERDCMMFEDDRSFLTNSYYRSSARKKDYERYFILASRYGHMDEVEFTKDERPGRRYWVRALDGCLKFQRIWGAYWAVQSLRRYKGAKQFQKIIRGYLAWKKYHPLIIFRLKYGKSSYLKYSMHRWLSYIHLIKECRESIAWWMVNWVDVCFENWRSYAKQCKQKKIDKARKVFAQFLNAGLARCFRAWAFMAQRNVYIKKRARRILGACGPQFDLWCEYVETSKHLRKMYKTTSKMQSIVRMFLNRRIFKAKRKNGFRLGVVMRARYATLMLRNAAVNVDFQEWKQATEERRAVAALEAERARLGNLQAAIVEREKAVRPEMRKHLRSRAGRIQLTEAATSMMQSVVFQKEQEEKRLYACCLELGKQFVTRDFLIEHPPLFKCIDPTCCTTFTSEEQYHLHMKNAPKHRPSTNKRGKLSTATDTLTQSEGDTAKIVVGSRKRVTQEMKYLDRERSIEAAYAPMRNRFASEGGQLQSKISELEASIAAKVGEIDQMEQANRAYKLEYVKESKSIKVLLQGLELGQTLTKQEEIKKVTEKQNASQKLYASAKTAHASGVAALQKEIERNQKAIDGFRQEFSELKGRYNAETDIYNEKMSQLKAEKDAYELKKQQDAEAARKKREAEEADFHSKLSLSTLHCLLVHPAEFLVLRQYLLSLLPDDAVVRPPPPTPEVIQRAQEEAAKKEQEERERAEEEQKAKASVVKVNGWTYVKGKGWVASKPTPKLPRQRGGKGTSSSNKGSTSSADRIDSTESQHSHGRRLTHATEASGTSSSAGRHLSKVAANATGEPARINSMPEVHLLNCLDLWKAIQLWKDTVLSTDPAYTIKALRIFQTYLLPETPEEKAAAEAGLQAARNGGGSGESPNSGPNVGTVVGSGGVRSIRGSIGKRLSSAMRHASRIWSKLRRRGQDQDSDSDVESDLDSDSSDDEEVKITKRTKRAKREEENREAIIVKRTVDLGVLDKSFSKEAAGALIDRLSFVLSKYKGQRKIPIVYKHEAKQKLSWWRRMLRVKAKAFDSWTDAFVIPPNIFDDLHWALFNYLFDKIHNQSKFETSQDFMQYRILCAADASQQEKALFKEATLARHDRFKAWARTEFVDVFRAQYRRAKQCADIVLSNLVDSLVDRALLVLVGENIWQTSINEQIQRESANMTADDVVYWVETRLANEWYDNTVEAYVKTLIGMGGETRANLMAFIGMREISSMPKVKKAYNIKEMKSSANLLDSFLNAADDPPPPAQPQQTAVDAAIQPSSEEKGVAASDVDSVDKPSRSNTAAAAEPEKKLSAAQKALLDMQSQGHEADDSLLPLVGVSGDSLSTTTKNKSKKDKLDRITAIKRIQKRVRGMLGRKIGRAVFVKVWFKRFDAAHNAIFYANAKTQESQWYPPRIYKTLFPWQKKQW